jgi:hypothetical protein
LVAFEHALERAHKKCDARHI